MFDIECSFLFFGLLYISLHSCQYFCTMLSGPFLEEGLASESQYLILHPGLSSKSGGGNGPPKRFNPCTLPSV